MSCGSGGLTISVQDVAEACTKQKYGKALGLDGIAMEAFIDGGVGYMCIYVYYLICLCTPFIYEECD